MGSGGYDKDTYEEPASRKLSQPAVQDAEQAAEEGFGDDFDDFEAGAINEDFGDFNQDIQQSSLPSNSLAKSEPEAPSSQLLPPVDIPFVSDARLNMFNPGTRPWLTHLIRR